MDPPVPGAPPGHILIKMKGNELVNISDMKIPNFAKSKPLSVANTVQLLKEHEAEHNAKQIVRKFLGDFLQGVEAINKNLIYLSGDKPATVMYYLLCALKEGPYNLGGYVEKGTPCMIYLHDHTIIHNISLSTHSNLGGGGLKDKKRVRRSRKRRTNRRKKTNRKKKTQRRKTKRRSNRRNTNKRRTVRRKNSKRRSTRRKK